MICIIAALGENGVIGSKKGLPWDIPEEYAQFLNQVRGNTVIMGRVSWEIFGADLPETRFIVVSSSRAESKGVKTVASIEEAVQAAKTFPEPIFIAGGAKIYKAGLKFADEMHLSFIKGKHSGNVFFPDFNQDDWIITKTEDHREFIYREYSRTKWRSHVIVK